MIKVLHILTDSNFGGAGRYVLNYFANADRQRFALKIVLPEGSVLIPGVEQLGIPVIAAPSIADRSWSREGQRVLRRIIDREKPDIVHTHGSLSGRVAAKRAGVRVLYTRHCAFPVPGYLRHGPGHWLYGALDRHYADHIIAVSPAAEENLLQLGARKKDITVMMNGAPPLRRYNAAQREAARAALGLPEGVFTGVILARLEPYKGHMLLLEAAAQLRREGRDFRFLLGGAGSFEQELREKRKAFGLEDQVQLLGFVQDVEPLLNAADIQFNCSYGTETSSIAIIEGMSIGLPALVSDYGGNPWLVDEGKSGLLFPSQDSSALAEKIRLLMDGPALRQKLGEGALAAYAQRFTGEIFARNIEKVYALLAREK